MLKKLVQIIKENIFLIKKINEFCKRNSNQELQINPELFFKNVNKGEFKLGFYNIKSEAGYIHKARGGGLRVYAITDGKIHDSDYCFYDKSVLINEIEKN